LWGGDLCTGGLPCVPISVHDDNRGRSKRRPYTLLSNRNKSAVSAANGARTAELFG
jgi:hypothetical protein